MITLSQVQAFAFDLDGTLIDSIPDLAAAANAMRQFLGMSYLPAEQIQSYVGDGIGRLVHRALTDSKEAQAEQILWEKGFTFFMQYYSEHITDHTIIYPDVENGLALLRSAGYPLVVITNKTEFLAVRALKNLGLIDYFSLVIGGDTLAEKKPSALPLQHMADVLQITTEQIAMVGDSRNDILSARNAGSVAIGVSYGYETVADYQPDCVIEQLSKLYDVLHPSEVKH
ncbi:phosphoglycolate phosphatase [Neisseria sp. Ec49-e6-T10]